MKTMTKLNTTYETIVKDIAVMNKDLDDFKVRRQNHNCANLNDFNLLILGKCFA